MDKNNFPSKDAVQSVIKFLQLNVPKVDVVNIEDELKKSFLLSKSRSKGLRKPKLKKKNRTLTRVEKKKLGFYNIPRDSVKYEDVLPMYDMWMEYMSQLLEDDQVPHCGSKNWDVFTQSVYKADFHGSMIKVVRSKCPSYVNKLGICIMDTKNTFKIVSEDNIVTTVPKRDCVFEIISKKFKITLFGKHLCTKPAERSTKKIKSYSHPDL